MATLNPTLLGAGFPTAPTPDAETLATPDVGRVEAFEAAISRQEIAQVEGVAPASSVSDVNAVDRTRQTLGLDSAPSATTPPTGGDVILDGLAKLRGNFDASSTRINAAMNMENINATGLLEVQVELVRFSLLTDVTSKLVGKSTQAFDTLMKGQ